MNEKNRGTGIKWPFAPAGVRTNRDTRFLKIIAMLAMFCDHAGKMLFPQFPVMRIIGRIAFPIFAYCVACGCVYTHDAGKYIGRLALLALITQPIYAVALNHTVPAMYEYSFSTQPVMACVQFYVQSWVGHPGVLVTLVIGASMCRFLREKRFALLIGLGVAVWHLSGHIDYGWKGVALILLFYMTCHSPFLTLPVVGAFMFWWAWSSGSAYDVLGMKFGMQLFAMLALPLICLQTGAGKKIHLPQWMYYTFYPLHMVIIYVLDKFVM